MTLIDCINKTRMNENSKKKTIALLSLLEYKIYNGMVLGDKNLYNIINFKKKVLELLKGSNGNWVREAPISYTDLDLIFVKKFKHVFGLESYVRTTESRDCRCILSTTNQYPAIFTWNGDTSQYFEVVEIGLEKLTGELDVLKDTLDIQYTIQESGKLVKINMMNNALDKLRFSNQQPLEPEPDNHRTK